MATVVLNIPVNKENQMMNYFKRHHVRIRFIKHKEDEDLIANWIDEGMKSKEVSEEDIFNTLRNNGVKI